LSIEKLERVAVDPIVADAPDASQPPVAPQPDAEVLGWSSRMKSQEWACDTASIQDALKSPGKGSITEIAFILA
jgi:hypothetical protein